MNVPSGLVVEQTPLYIKGQSIVYSVAPERVPVGFDMQMFASPSQINSLFVLGSSMYTHKNVVETFVFHCTIMKF